MKTQLQMYDHGKSTEGTQYKTNSNKMHEKHATDFEKKS